jgi:hypothetical protein
VYYLRPLSLLIALFAWATPLEAQAVADIMNGIRNGGGWVGVPIEGGRGSIATIRLPTFGLTLSGCVQVSDRNSGVWELEALDRIGGARLSEQAEPGEGIEFDHTFGVSAQLQFDFEWSEPRDTTLILWVGLARTGEPARSACAPAFPIGG